MSFRPLSKRGIADARFDGLQEGLPGYLRDPALTWIGGILWIYGGMYGYAPNGEFLQGVQLIWPSICQARNHRRPAEAGLPLGPGGGGRPGARLAVRLICAGWVPQDRISSWRPPSRTGRRRDAAAHS